VPKIGSFQPNNNQFQSEIITNRKLQNEDCPPEEFWALAEKADMSDCCRILTSGRVTSYEFSVFVGFRKSQQVTGYELQVIRQLSAESGI